MRAALIGPDASFVVDALDDPAPGVGDLVLRVTGCGICGSDLKARGAMPAGTVMGHEFCGEVVAAGSDAAARWHEGDRAAVLPVVSCGTCQFCRAGDVAHCSAAQLVGLGGPAGGFAELVKVRASTSYPLPPGLPESYGPLVEPFAVGLHTVNRAELDGGEKILVLGAGPVGLTTTSWLRQAGAGDITVSDPSATRRAATATFGATEAIDPTVDELGGPYDVVVDCVGKPGLLDAAFGVVRPLGRVVVAGLCAEPDPYLPLVPFLKETTIRFAVYYHPAEFQQTVDAFVSGQLDPGPMVTDVVGLGQLDEAFGALMSSQTDLKILVDPRVDSPPSAPTGPEEP